MPLSGVLAPLTEPGHLRKEEVEEDEGTWVRRKVPEGTTARPRGSSARCACSSSLSSSLPWPLCLLSSALCPLSCVLGT